VVDSPPNKILLGRRGRARRRRNVARLGQHGVLAAARGGVLVAAFPGPELDVPEHDVAAREGLAAVEPDGVPGVGGAPDVAEHDVADLDGGAPALLVVARLVQ